MIDPPQDQRPRGTSPARILAVLLAAGVTLLALLGWFAWSRVEPWTTLTRESYDEARKRWEQTGIEDYEIEVEVFGRQPAVYRVEVRDGLARRASRNGAPLRQQRTWETWSVPGMFDTIGIDLENIERVADGTADANTPRLTVRVIFHPQYGFPARYMRIERAGIGENPEVRWQVRQFKVLSR